MTQTNKSILVVEDNRDIAESLCDSLESCGYNICAVASSYNEAISHFDTYSPDLVTLDINLKGEQTGIDVAQYIRKNSKVPFIYLSGSIDRESIARVKATNPFAFLVKPYELFSLEATLQSVFNNYKPEEKETKKELPEFTSMEKVVLREIAMGHTSKKIASMLDLSQSTVKNHRHNICVKLKLERTTHSLLSWVLSNKTQLRFDRI